MKRLLPMLALLVVACQPRPAAVVASPPAASASTATDSVQRVNDAYVRDIMASIRGREHVRADSVFKNVQWLRDVPARTFLTIMNGGYSRALGVTCEHCHVTTDFASDTKRPKNAAREMAVMHRAINTQLRQMQHLRPQENRAINCMTCHRGRVNPLSAAPPGR